MGWKNKQVSNASGAVPQERMSWRDGSKHLIDSPKSSSANRNSDGAHGGTNSNLRGYVPAHLSVNGAGQERAAFGDVQMHGAELSKGLLANAGDDYDVLLQDANKFITSSGRNSSRNSQRNSNYDNNDKNHDDDEEQELELFGLTDGSSNRELMRVLINQSGPVSLSFLLSIGAPYISLVMAGRYVDVSSYAAT